jgi:hypothetical protein
VEILRFFAKQRLAGACRYQSMTRFRSSDEEKRRNANLIREPRLTQQAGAARQLAGTPRAIPGQKTRWTTNLSFFSAMERIIVLAFY